MTPQIKQRIEQIRRGEVPEGYKRTKAGVVPIEWEETRLSRYLVVNSDKNISLQYGKEDVFSISGELGIVNQIELLGRSYAGVSVAPYGIVYPNDVVYTKSPLKANPYGIIKTNKTGKTGIVSTLYAIFRCKDNVCPDFVQSYFELDQNLNNYLYPIVNIGAKHDMKISDENSLKGWVVFPPLVEQEKIAEILSAQDKLIALKEKLIEEKKRQKKYLMQQLLTPPCNTTLPLSKIATITMGQSPDSASYNDDFIGMPLIQGNADIMNRTPSPRMYTSLPTKKCNNNDILLSVRAPVGTVSRSNIHACIGRGMCAINAGELTDYIYQYLLFHEDKWGRVSQGSTFESISGDDIAKVSIPLYDNHQEIQMLLSSADHELDLLNRDLNQEKQKKKALMQLLMSGVVRVNV